MKAILRLEGITKKFPGIRALDGVDLDIYPGEKVYTSQADRYLSAALNCSEERKMVYLTENGCLFDPDLAKRDGGVAVACGSLYLAGFVLGEKERGN